MGAKLFKYESKKTTLTEEGKILQNHAYKIFFDIEQTKNDIRNFSGKLRTQIKIGASGSHLTLLPCSKFNKLHPDILLNLEEHSSKTILESVKNGKLDIGIIYSSIDNPSIKSEVLNVEKYSAVVSLNSKFAKNESISLMDLINEPIVLMPKSSASRKNIDEAFNCINHICKPMIQVANLTSCVTLIQDSDNISILPESFIKSLCNKPFKILPISDYPPRETINLIYRKDLFLDPILKDFLTIIKDFHNND